MLIGLAYDLRQDYLDAGYGEEETAEFDKRETIEALEAVLRGLGHEVDAIGRVNTLVERLARGDRWDLVFNIAEGLHGSARESQVPALLDAYQIPYTFSDPLVCGLTLHKGMAKRVVRDLGLPTPDFAVVESPEDVAKINLRFPLFAKPIAEGTSKGVSARSKVDSRAELKAICDDLLREFHQPTLVERYLPGREVTVGIVGTGQSARVVGVMEVLLFPGAEREIYSYDNKQNWEGRVGYQLLEGALGDEARKLGSAVWRGLGCRDGGRVDLRADEHGRLNFIEVNPLPGLNPDSSDLPILARLAGVSYRELIGLILDSARMRVQSPAVAEPVE